MSLIGLWARRCWKWAALILGVSAAAEAGLFLWAMARDPYAYPEQLLQASPVTGMARIAFIALTFLLAAAGAERGAHPDYTLRRLAVTEREAFLCRALHNTLCYVVLWGAQLAVMLCLCLVWKLRNPAQWENQTLLLTFCRVPLLHALLPLSEWYVYLRNVLLCAALGCAMAGRRASNGVVMCFTLMLGFQFPHRLGEGLGWVIYLSAASLAVILITFVRSGNPNPDETEREVADDGAQA